MFLLPFTSKYDCPYSRYLQPKVAYDSGDGPADLLWAARLNQYLHQFDAPACSVASSAHMGRFPQDGSLT